MMVGRTSTWSVKKSLGRVTPEIRHAGTRDHDEGARDLRLIIAMVPGESVTLDRGRRAVRLEVKIRIAEQRERRRAIRIGRGYHVQQLLRDRICHSVGQLFGLSGDRIDG